jgi:dGTPase
MWTERRSGKSHKRDRQDHRDPFERDRTRVIHCPAFRRLQRKTQILGTDEGDFHRTRLTHSLEVASIGRSIIRNLSQSVQSPLKELLPSDDLISTICLLHDIGHPPFGHGGEVALNYMMRNHGGFEGNGQTLRLLTKIEQSYGSFGLDLTRRSLLGILKYPVRHSLVRRKKYPTELNSITKQIRVNDWLPPKAYFDSEQGEVDWILAPLSTNDKELFQSIDRAQEANKHSKTRFKSLDCSIMDVADDIAYGVHDLEDAIHLKLINRDQLINEEFWHCYHETTLSQHEESKHLIDNLFSQDISLCKQSIGAMVNYFITSTEITLSDDSFEQELLKYNVGMHANAKRLLSLLQQCIFDSVIDSQESRTFEYGGQTVVLRLFEAISSNPASLLDNKNRQAYLNIEDSSEGLRIVCDYIANMTDEYAYRMHERLFGFNTRTIFERL